MQTSPNTLVVFVYSCCCFLLLFPKNIFGALGGAIRGKTLRLNNEIFPKLPLNIASIVAYQRMQAATDRFQPQADL